MRSSDANGRQLVAENTGQPRRGYTVRELSEAYGIHYRTVHYLMDRGELPFVRLGRHKVALTADVERFEKARRQTGEVPDQAAS